MEDLKKLILCEEVMLKKFLNIFDISFLSDNSKIALAYSGGIDSSVLLDLAFTLFCNYKIQFYVFHINHGLSSFSDKWLIHCKKTCEIYKKIIFHSFKIDLFSYKKNIEENARIKRYHALKELCQKYNIKYLLTGHNQDDQAETVLLKLLRGSGISGVSGIYAINNKLSLLNNSNIVLIRPLLYCSRHEIIHYAKLHSLSYLQDESNNNIRYTRNILRLYVMPLLKKLFPGFQKRFSQFAYHAQSAEKLLTLLAEKDLKVCLKEKSLDIRMIKKFDSDRVKNLLRYWLNKYNKKKPSAIWLNKLYNQILENNHHKKISIMHAQYHIKSYRNQLFCLIKEKVSKNINKNVNQLFIWNNESKIIFSNFNGILYFYPVTGGEIGINVLWLRKQLLLIKSKTGKERLKLTKNSYNKNIKNYYREMSIPPWNRFNLPIIYVQKINNTIFNFDNILYAAGIGINYVYQTNKGERIRLHWIDLDT
ncbi:tRNA lysidine(34) synthetase TilS [Candidatus Profftella armatura (Diaphorina cf. continua)]|uniref:tRNA(Ile)-lysidine synthase n=1 Tax=Candidatus Profftella armatura (Diaphorina cf. continua) TaxID=2661583 RepID=A0A7R6VZV3_9PROT|nr:tRNA lysidine(34) synthetase TilS [Candidatus Profftella armatura (Diaphorina cf. continua)]BCG49691.1 tRNA lysidine(34) synthetase TilS [Candidatus Profftella armatura (Diaphorina cf. continua)]